MVFLIHGSNPFKQKPFHNFLNFWCHFHPIITLLSLIFISQCTCNENIRPWHHFSRIKMVFNLMSLAVKQHCPRDVIRTKLSSPPLFIYFFYFEDIAKTCGTFMIRGEEKAFEHCCPISHSYCEWLSVKLMVWGRWQCGRGETGCRCGYRASRYRKQSFPSHRAHARTRTRCRAGNARGEIGIWSIVIVCSQHSHGSLFCYLCILTHFTLNKMCWFF